MGGGERGYFSRIVWVGSDQLIARICADFILNAEAQRCKGAKRYWWVFGMRGREVCSDCFDTRNDIGGIAMAQGESRGCQGVIAFAADGV